MVKFYFATKLQSYTFTGYCISMHIKINWDALGIATSIACAIHCALLPILLTSLSIFGIELIDNRLFEMGMIILAFAIGSYAFYHGWKHHHKSILPFLIFCLGIGCLFAKQVWHQWQLWFLVPAVLLIVTAHYINFKLSKRQA